MMFVIFKNQSLQELCSSEKNRIITFLYRLSTYKIVEQQRRIVVFFCLKAPHKLNYYFS